MMAFVVAAGLLAAAALALVLWPLRLRAQPAEGAEPTAVRRSRLTALALGLGLPLAAAALYLLAGTPGLLRERPHGGAASDEVADATGQADIERMVGQLAARLEREPDDAKGWVMLARSYKVMGRTAEAERAYDRAGAFIAGNAQELAHHADVAASNAGGRFEGKPRKLLAQALQADPQNAMALWLAGSAELQAGQARQALRYWEQLLPLLPPGSEDARAIEDAIAQARQRAS